MMIILKKHFILLRRHGDDAQTPFNLSQYPFYDYEVTGGNQRELAPALGAVAEW